MDLTSSGKDRTSGCCCWEPNMEWSHIVEIQQKNEYTFTSLAIKINFYLRWMEWDRLMMTNLALNKNLLSMEYKLEKQRAIHGASQPSWSRTYYYFRAPDTIYQMNLLKNQLVRKLLDDWTTDWPNQLCTSYSKEQ